MKTRNFFSNLEDYYEYRILLLYFQENNLELEFSNNEKDFTGLFSKDYIKKVAKVINIHPINGSENFFIEDEISRKNKEINKRIKRKTAARRRGVQFA